MNGLLVIDKPGRMTSRDVVNIAQRWFPRGTKLGHTGTLDPLATGVLVLCVGAATKVADRIQALGKTYFTRLRLGATSDSDDADGAIIANESAVPPALLDIQTILSKWIGEVQQRPPRVSAVKVGGRRAYKLARQGKPLDLQPRTVRIESIDLKQYDWPYLDLVIHCGKGTYIRSLARDVGEALRVGGLVETLRRTRVGPFYVENALALPCEADTAQARLQPIPPELSCIPSPLADNRKS